MINRDPEGAALTWKSLTASSGGNAEKRVLEGALVFWQLPAQFNSEPAAF
jgi:hypothetical protein